MASAELRWRWSDTIALSAFYDAGSVTVNPRNDYAGASALNSYGLDGAGLVLVWSGEGGVSAKLVWARRLGDNPNPSATGRDQDGTLVRDYFFVDDAADAYLALADHAHDALVVGQAFNFSADEPLTVLEVIARVGQALGQELVPDIKNEAQHEISAQRLSSAKAARVLGWQARHSFDAALAVTVAWYRAFLAR
jgi:nucleoside-diphosphate-sugar epimerase